MERDVYKKLAQHLDNLPGGFPPTETGVELRILRRLFTPEEAELAVHLNLIAEEPCVSKATRHFWIPIVAWAVACVFPPVLRNL